MKRECDAGDCFHRMGCCYCIFFVMLEVICVMDLVCGMMCVCIMLEASRAFRVNRFHVEGGGE